MINGLGAETERSLGSRLRARSWSQLVGQFQQFLKSLNRSPRTVGKYAMELRFFLGFLSDRSIEALDHVSWRDLEDYRVSLAEHGYSPGTVDVKLRSVKRFYEFLKKTGLTESNPAQDIISPSTARRNIKPVLSIEETLRLLDAPDKSSPIGVRDRAILETFYSTGIRLAELCALLLDDIDLERGFLTVRNGKGGKDRVVPIGIHACSRIRVYLEHARPWLVKNRPLGNGLFVGQKGKRIHHLIVERFTKAYARDVGITKRTTPHLLRHSCASHLLRNGADVVFVQKLLGHKFLSSTQRYLRAEDADVRRMVKTCHPREQYAKRDNIE